MHACFIIQSVLDILALIFAWKCDHAEHYVFTALIEADYV